jgi:hypothetical protein
VRSPDPQSHGPRPASSSAQEPAGRLGRLWVVRFWLSLGAALVVLNAALTFHNVWPTWWITTRHELSIDFVALLLLLALYSERVRIPSHRVMTGLALVWLVLLIGRYAEVTAPALYGRPVNLYWDAQHVLNVAAMLSEASAPLRVALGALALVALLALAFGLFRWSLSQVRTGLEFKPARRALLALSAALVAFYAVGLTSMPIRTKEWFSVPVTRTYWQQAEFALGAYRQAQRTDEALCAQAPPGHDLTRLAGADVVVMFIESYGATTYDRPDVAAVVAPGRKALAEAVASSGRQVVSAFVESPTFGGSSWLAHMSLLTGRPIRDQGMYSLVLTQDCEVLTKAFASSGYRVVSLMPGLKLEWPEGAFYGFHKIYGERALAYGGPDFGWWRIPDQYALAKVDELEFRKEPRAPLLLFFPTINSHVPFRPTPPYQPDWARVLTAQPYDAQSVAESLAVEPNWMNLGADYAATLAYVFDYLSGYLREQTDREIVLIVLGDHQPPASVSGEGARWDVPVHVIASRTELLDALIAAGFVPGVEPATESIGPMHALPRLLLGGADARSARSARGTASPVGDPLGIDVARIGVLGQAGNEPPDSLHIEPLGPD